MAAIFDEIGGEPAVSAAVEIFYGKVLDDPSLAGYFDRVDMAELQTIDTIAGVLAPLKTEIVS